MSFLRGLIASALVYGASVVSSIAGAEKLQGRSKTYLPVETDAGTINCPVYPISEVSANSCARHARMTAEELFGMKYPAGNAWDRKYLDQLVTNVSGNVSVLETLDEAGVLKPGMLVAIHNPKSRYLNGRDSKGNKIKDTHIVTFNGENKSGKNLYNHQFGNRVKVETAEEMAKYGLKPVAVFAPKGYVVKQENSPKGRVLDAEDYLNVARIMYAEAASAPRSDRIIVGKSVLNRVAHPKYPDSVVEVIHDRNAFHAVKDPRHEGWEEANNPEKMNEYEQRVFRNCLRDAAFLVAGGRIGIPGEDKIIAFHDIGTSREELALKDPFWRKVDSVYSGKKFRFYSN